MAEALRQIRNTLRRRAGKLLVALIGLGLSFGFIAVVLAVVHASWKRLPDGVENGSYVSLSRDTTSPFGYLALIDYERIAELVPEVRWLYTRYLSIQVPDAADGPARRLQAAGVPADFFEILGVDAALGALAPPAPDALGIVLSHEAWRRDYGGRSSVTDEFMTVAEGVEAPIVGVAPAEFTGIAWPMDLWVLNPTPQLSRRGAAGMDDALRLALHRRMPSSFVFGRIDDAHGDADSLRTLLAEYSFDATPISGSASDIGEDKRTLTFYHTGIGDSDRLVILKGLETRPAERRETVQKTLWLGVVAALLLVLAFVSLIDLLLAETAARDAEQAVRIALGATPADVFRQTLAENAFWVAAMAAVGWLSFRYAADLLLGVEPFSAYLGELASASSRVGLAASAVLLAAAFLASVGYVSRFVARHSKAIAAAVRRPARLLAATRRVLLFVAAASMLVVLSLAARYVGDARYTLRFAATDALIVRTYGDREQSLASQVGLDAIAALPGVAAVTTADLMPLDDPQRITHRQGSVKERPDLADLPFLEVTAPPSYLPTLGVAMLAGRVYDAEAAGNEVVISRSAAQALAGDPQDALGMAITFEGRMEKQMQQRMQQRFASAPQGDGEQPALSFSTPAATVVGVVDDVPYGDYADAALHAIYDPPAVYAEFAEFDYATNFHRWLIVHAGTAEAIVESMRQSPTFAGWTVDAEGTPASRFREQFLAKRSVELLLSGAAAFALLLALAGVGNSLARSIGEARGAIGIAFALGATQADLAWRYFGGTARDLLLAAVLVAAAAVLAKLALPIVAAVVDLWLLAPMLALLVALCAGICFVLLRQLARRAPISALVQDAHGSSLG